MEKLKQAIYDFDELGIRIDGIAGLSFLLWEAITEGNFAINKDTHGSAAYLLNNEIEKIRNELQDIKDRFYEGLREVKE